MVARVAFVTGGTSGIGLAVATALAARGETVLAVGRDPERCRAAQEQLRRHGDASAEPVDVAEPGALRVCVDTLLARTGRVDHLVTAAGQLARGSILDLGPEDFRAAFDVNVLGTWWALQAVLPTMTSRRYGRVVTVGSVLGTVAAPERGGYAATKAAVHALTRTAALETAGTGVTVNCVAPGPTRTPMNQGDREVDAAAQAAFSAKVPLGRWATPDEVATVVLSLLAPANAFTTGAVVHVDGGYTAQ